MAISARFPVRRVASAAIALAVAGAACDASDPFDGVDLIHDTPGS